MATTEDGQVGALLDHLAQERGVDLSVYRRSTVDRRVRARMQAVDVDTVADYTDHLQAHPAELAALLDALLINVTGFMRDAEAWQTLRDEILPTLVASRATDEPLRVWSAGCSSGEEAYSLAIVLCEVLGVEQFVSRVKIYATDVDGQALATARAGAYDAAQLESLDEDLVGRYFVPESGYGQDEPTRWLFRPDLRRAVIFGQHDLVGDAPISRLDLLVCRNTMMYFHADLQLRLLQRFHFALRPDGVLFLGRAERLLGRAVGFVPIDAPRRFFRKVADDHAAPRVQAEGSSSAAVDQALRGLDLRDAALDSGTLGIIAVDPDGYLVLANAAARTMFSLHPRDLGRPLKDLELSYRPVELRGAIDQARDTGQSISIRNARWSRRPGLDEVHLDVEVVPTHDDDTYLGAVIHVEDVTDRVELERTTDLLRQQLDTAYEELETTNEEMQTTLEEYETTNEEMQSTNEELEAMNRELDAVNQALEAGTAPLERRSIDLRESNELLLAALGGVDHGVVLLDDLVTVRAWNDRAEDLWGLHESEAVGRRLDELDIGLPVAELADVVRDLLATGAEEASIDLDATTRRGVEVVCRMSCAPVRTPDGQVRGVVVLMAPPREPVG